VAEGMSKKERFLTAVQLGVPDMVPVAPLIHNRFAYRVLGCTGWRPVFEVHRMIGSIHFRGPLSVGWDVEWDSGYGEGSFLLHRAGRRTVHQHIIKTPIGTLSSKTVSGMIPHDPMVSKTVEYFIKTPEDYRIYKAYLEELLRRARPNFVDVEEAVELMGEEGMPNIGLSSAFNQLGDARGMYHFLGDLYRMPEMIRNVMESLHLVKEKQVEAFLDSLSEVLYYDVCWAFDMSPRHFREWVLPELKRVVRQVRRVENKYIGFYFLGKMKAIMPRIMESRPHYVETFETLGGDLSLREAKKLYGKEVCIMGNYDPVTLAHGTPEEARREALRCLEEGMDGGGYVMVTGDEVPGDTRMENLKIMVKTVEEHGRYH